MNHLKDVVRAVLCQLDIRVFQEPLLILQMLLGVSVLM